MKDLLDGDWKEDIISEFANKNTDSNYRLSTSVNKTKMKVKIGVILTRRFLPTKIENFAKIADQDLMNPVIEMKALTEAKIKKKQANIFPNKYFRLF